MKEKKRKSKEELAFEKAFCIYSPVYSKKKKLSVKKIIKKGLLVDEKK